MCIALLQIDSTEILVQFILSIALIALGKISNLLRSHCSAQKTFATNNHNQNRIDMNNLVQVLTVMSGLITVFNCVIYVSVHIMFEHKKWLDTSALFNGENDVCIWDTEFNEKNKTKIVWWIININLNLKKGDIRQIKLKKKEKKSFTFTTQKTQNFLGGRCPPNPPTRGRCPLDPPSGRCPEPRWGMLPQTPAYSLFALKGALGLVPAFTGRRPKHTWHHPHDATSRKVSLTSLVCSASVCKSWSITRAPFRANKL